MRGIRIRKYIFKNIQFDVFLLGLKTPNISGTLHLAFSTTYHIDKPKEKTCFLGFLVKGVFCVLLVNEENSPTANKIIILFFAVIG